MRFLLNKSIILFLFILPSLVSCGSNNQGTVITGWEILYEQGNVLEEISQKKEWKKIDIHTLFQLPYKPIRDCQYVWLRSKIQIDNPAKYYGLHLGRIYHTDKTYINGFVVGEHSANELNSVHYPRNYKLYNETLKKGENLIYIYLGVYGREFGGILNAVTLLPKTQFISQKIFDDFIFSILPIGIVVFLVGFLIFNLIIFFWDRKEKIYIYTASICVAFALYILSVFSPWFPFSIDIRITFLWSCPASFSILFMLFIQRFYKMYLVNYNRVFIPLLLLTAFVILINPDTTSDYYFADILGTISMFSVTLIITFLVYKVNVIKPDRAVYVFFFFGILPGGVFISWDIVNYLWIYHYPPLTHTYTIPLFIIISIIYVIREHIVTRIELDRIYQKLNKSDIMLKEPEKALSAMEKSEKESKVTSATEKKLEMVKAFIDENYLHDISREGLANATGISPDHMSRMFLTYTGKKVNSYINELRIKKAAEDLIQSDQKIVEIAFSVGFESLVTFNRSFLKIMGITPTKFRKTHEQDRSDQEK